MTIFKSQSNRSIREFLISALLICSVILNIMNFVDTHKRAAKLKSVSDLYNTKTTILLCEANIGEPHDSKGCYDHEGYEVLFNKDNDWVIFKREEQYSLSKSGVLCEFVSLDEFTKERYESEAPVTDPDSSSGQAVSPGP